MPFGGREYYGSDGKWYRSHTVMHTDCDRNKYYNKAWWCFWVNFLLSVVAIYGWELLYAKAESAFGFQGAVATVCLCFVCLQLPTAYYIYKGCTAEEHVWSEEVYEPFIKLTVGLVSAA